MELPPPLAAGYSLLELVIVLVMLGMATAITFPTISRITTHSRVNQAAMIVAQDLSLALSDAARERKPIRIARGADRASITLSERANGTLLSTRWLGQADAYGLDSVAFSVSPVDLFPSGMTSSALRVTLWSGTYSRQVTMSRAGWVRVP
jgi:type II secretory pathway pseudopilin PulG